MKRNLFWLMTAVALMAMVALLASGCGGSSPTQTAEKFTQHLNKREFGDAYDMLSSSSPVRAISRDDFVKNAESSLPQGALVDGFQVTEETINGDQATVKWNGTEKVSGQPDNPQSGSWTLNKEDDQWKLQP